MEQTSMPEVSLCTYTYNDANLLLDLLESVKQWTHKPAEIIVVDDHSDQELVAGDLPLACRLVRLPRHKGLTRAKHYGPSLARGRYILSMDCDTRITRDWLKKCLPVAAREDVGLVTGPLAQAAGDDLVSRFLRHFGDNHNAYANGEVDFAPGNARLMRQAVWKRIGGLSGHHKAICEDRYLCALLRRCGYQIQVVRGAMVTQVRKLTRLAMVKRFINWNFEAYKGSMPACDEFYDFVFLNFVLEFFQVCSRSLELNEPLFAYLGFMELVLAVSTMLDYGLARLGYDPEVKTGWMQAIYWHLRAYPSLFRLLADDLGWGEAAQAVIGAPNRWSTRWDRSFKLLGTLSGDNGLWAWMDNQGVELINAEDSRLSPDFSFHADYIPA